MSKAGSSKACCQVDQAAGGGWLLTTCAQLAPCCRQTPGRMWRPLAGLSLYCVSLCSLTWVGLLATPCMPSSQPVPESLQSLSVPAVPCLQETPDPPQALSCVPTLQLSDIPREVSTVPTAITETHGVTQLTHELFTNDVLYLETAFDLRVIPADLLPLVPLFCR